MRQLLDNGVLILLNRAINFLIIWVSGLESLSLHITSLNLRNGIKYLRETLPLLATLFYGDALLGHV